MLQALSIHVPGGQDELRTVFLDKIRTGIDVA